MSTHSSLKPALLTAAGLLSLVLSLGSVTAEPRPVDHAQRPHAPRGDWSSHTERQRTENGHTAQTTWTGSNGKTATRDATVVNDKEAQDAHAGCLLHRSKRQAKLRARRHAEDRQRVHA